MSLNSSLGLNGRLEPCRLTVADRERSKRRAIFWWKVRHFFTQRWREMPLEALLLFCLILKALVPGFNMPMHGRLRIKVRKADGEIWDYGHIGVHLIVDAGKAFVVDAFQNTVELENMNFHGIGTGNTAPAAGDTALQTELTTQYSSDNTRATGTKSEPATNQYRTVGTNSVDSSVAITEWGLLSQSGVGGGTLFDRQTFGAINLASSDSLQTTYTLTVG